MTEEPPPPAVAEEPPPPGVAEEPPPPAVSEAPPGPHVAEEPPPPAVAEEPPVPPVAEESPPPAVAEEPPPPVPPVAEEPPAPLVSEAPPVPPVTEESPAPLVAQEPPAAPAPAPPVEESSAPSLPEVTPVEPPPPTEEARPPVAVPAEVPAAVAAAGVGASEADAPSTPAPPRPKPKTPAAPPPAKRGFISSYFKPEGGGPIKVAQRVGILVLIAIVLATVGVLGYAGIRSRNAAVGTTGGTETPSSTATPSVSPSGPSYITYNDPVNQFSIPRPQDWVARGLASPDANIAMIVGPDAPYPIADFVAVTIHKLPFALSNADLSPFKDFILELLGSDINLIGQIPSPIVDGHAGYFFTWSYPKAAPTTLHQAYYLIDGDRFITILLQIEPPTDGNSLAALSPTFQHMASGFKSFHVTPSPTSTPTSPTATATPTARATPKPSSTLPGQ